jgi:hypothetical protein
MGENKLDILKSFKVTQLIEKEYESSALTDHEFAAYATRVLGFQVVKNHVENRRTALGIKSRMERVVASRSIDVGAVQELLIQMELRIKYLEEQIGTLYAKR